MTLLYHNCTTARDSNETDALGEISHFRPRNYKRAKQRLDFQVFFTEKKRLKNKRVRLLIRPPEGCLAR